MMIRMMVGGLALALVGLSGWTTETEAVGARSLPMQFELRQEGPAEVCGAHCRTWVSAVGTITSQTPHDFAEFAGRHDLRGAMLVLNSAGGSVHGAMALGRKVRQLDMTTSVGKTIELPRQRGSAEQRARLSPRADCESMCAFVLLAGTTRVVPPGARVLVHQIWLGDRRDDAAAATYSAEDLVLVQRDVGRLAQYTVEMGGSIDFFELSMRIPPWEPMRALSRDELRRMKVERGPEAMTVASTAPASTAVAMQALTSGTRRGPETGARGWVVAEQSGVPTLVRSHPLTVEGVEIGAFDLVFACGDAPDSLEIVYSERRRAPEGAVARLTAVTLSLAGHSEPLRVTSSEPLPRSLEIESRALGSVPVSFIRSFSEKSSSALVVSTVSASEARTTIRVGNSGVTRGLARIQQSCARRPLHASNTKAATGGAR